MAAVPTSKSSALSLKDYLRRYETGADDQKKKRNKKKKDKPQSRTVGGILVVDEDPVWQKPVQIEQEESEPSGDEKPQIEEDIEVKRMKRLDAIRARKPYHAISEDGSGWVSISDPSKTSKSAAIGRDICPPRQGRARFDTPSPEPKEKPSGSQNSDLSPPRQRRADTPSPEPEKAVAGDGTADISSPWRRSRDDNSPPRRTRRTHSPVPDLSPPRRSQKDLSDDPKVSSCQQDPVDLSPPRRRQRVSSPDISLPRRTRRLSPGAGGPRASDDADLSPPRKSSKCLSDHLSPPRRIHPQSPEAIRRQSSPVADLSPPRKSRKEAPSAKESRRAGLFSAKEIKEEIEKKKKEDTSRFASMDPFLSGRGAEPVFRDKEGKRISKEEMLKTQEKEKPKEKKLEWGKGLAQKREAEANAKELELEREKPFARTRDDPELDKMLKERIRWGDPMAHVVKRKSSDLILEDLGDNEKMKESGFIIPQTIPSHSWLKRGIDFPPNRYGTKPGRHWDGVDRSNGFEKELFKRQNEKRATEREAYLWSVSDM